MPPSKTPSPHPTKETPRPPCPPNPFPSSTTTTNPNPNPNPNPKTSPNLQSQISALEAEMEIAVHATNAYGQSRRRVSKKQRKYRTVKRKILELQDEKESAIQAVERKKRLRGSRVAFEDEVLKGSLIFGGDDGGGFGGGGGDGRGREEEEDGDGEEGDFYIGVGGEVGEEEEEDGGREDGVVVPSTTTTATPAQEENNNNNHEESDASSHASAGSSSNNNNNSDDDEDEPGRYEMYDSSIPLSSSDEDPTPTTPTPTPTTTTPHKKTPRKRTTSRTSNTLPPQSLHPSSRLPAYSERRIARTMYRLKNFKSTKMARKHGDALGAHARGLHRTAVAKLRKLGEAAPVAPQVYSSLGLVYENMLGEVERRVGRERRRRVGRRRRRRRRGRGEGGGENGGDGEVLDTNTNKDNDENDDEDEDEDDRIQHRLYLANKTYASYHIAACLCKQDYTLWIRSGDAALTIARIHQHCLTITPDFNRRTPRKEKPFLDTPPPTDIPSPETPPPPPPPPETIPEKTTPERTTRTRSRQRQQQQQQQQQQKRKVQSMHSPKQKDNPEEKSGKGGNDNNNNEEEEVFIRRDANDRKIYIHLPSAHKKTDGSTKESNQDDDDEESILRDDEGRKVFVHFKGDGQQMNTSKKKRHDLRNAQRAVNDSDQDNDCDLKPNDDDQNDENDNDNHKPLSSNKTPINQNTSKPPTTNKLVKVNKPPVTTTAKAPPPPILKTLSEYQTYHRTSRFKWLREARESYLAADNLHPPGITVPAKLAYTHMECGDLIEALTLLTDLKNNAQKIVMGSDGKNDDDDDDDDDGGDVSPTNDNDEKRGEDGTMGVANGKNAVEKVKRKDDPHHQKKPIQSLRCSELARSYPTWLLYADLMLRLGYACLRHNKKQDGILLSTTATAGDTNENYMLKRWLKKYAAVFDWRERRLQALCMALEAGAGSGVCRKLMEWVGERGECLKKKMEGGKTGEEVEEEKSFWDVQDGYEMDREKKKKKEGAEDKDDDDDGSGGEEGKGGDGEDKDKVEGKEEKIKDKHIDCKDELHRPSNNDDNDDGEGDDDKKYEPPPPDQQQPTILTIPPPSSLSTPPSPSTPPQISNIDEEINQLTIMFQRERTEFLKQKKMELEVFDNNITDGIQSADERKDIVERHKKAVVHLVVKHREKKAELEARKCRLALDESGDPSSLPTDNVDRRTTTTAATQKEGTGKTTTITTTTSTTTISQQHPSLPMSASCKTVINIGSQLIKLCLVMDLYHGGRLVAEAVSGYTKERAQRHEMRTKRLAYLDQKRASHHPSNSRLWMNKESYDDVIGGEVSDFSDDDDPRNIFLSDDEEFDDSQDSNEIMVLMKRGVMPPELQVLYGLSLIGEGNFYFLAERLLRSVDGLEDDEKDENKGNNVDSVATEKGGGEGAATESTLIIDHDKNSNTNSSLSNSNTGKLPEEDASWIVFRSSMVDPMTKTTAVAFIGDLLRRMGKEDEWSNRLQPLFEEQLRKIHDDAVVILLDQQGVANNDNDNDKKKNNEDSMATQHKWQKRTNYLKILLVTLRMRLCKAKSISDAAAEAVSEMVDYGDDLTKRPGYEALEIALSVIKTIIRFQEVLWSNASSDGIQNKTTIEVLRILSGSFTILMKGVHDLTPRTRNKLLSEGKKIVSWICQVSIPNYDEINPDMPQTSFQESLSTFPIQTDWQTPVHTSISKRTFNLGVSCTVSAFSGWELDEFTTRLLKKRKRRGCHHFGVNIEGERVTGFLSQAAEVELLNQWKLMGIVVPNLSVLLFEEGMKKAKLADWYVSVKGKMDKEGCDNRDPIDMFGESHALNILLLFSRLCLSLARNSEDTMRQESLLKFTFSIMLPLSQLALNEELWESSLGTAAAKEEGILNEWEHFVAPPNSTYKPPCRQKQTKKYTKPNDEINLTPEYNDEATSVLAKLVKVPSNVILQEWRGKEYFDDDDIDVDNREQTRRLNKWSAECSGSAKLAMKKVDYTIRRLRGCFTMHSLQRSSIQVAVALLDVASKKECQNPFLCLHQAAVFASHGSKGGNNDDILKKKLPENHECTPTEALCILGRADCLRAIHFTEEAMFLCSYVARVCCLHRDKKNTALSWTPQWRVIGIYMYTISLVIDSTIKSLTNCEARVELKTWGTSVKKEIARARCDAIAINRAYAKENLKDIHGIVPEETSDDRQNIPVNGEYNGEDDVWVSDNSGDEDSGEDEDDEMDVDAKCDSEEEDEGAITYSFDDGTEEIVNVAGGAAKVDNAIEDVGAVEMENGIEISDDGTEELVNVAGGAVKVDNTIEDVGAVKMEDGIKIPDYFGLRNIGGDTGVDGIMEIDDTLADIMGNCIVIPDSPIREKEDKCTADSTDISSIPKVAV